MHILAKLLPRGVDGGVSTAPLTYKPWMRCGRRRRDARDDAERRAYRRRAASGHSGTRGVHPPRHRARARLPARDEHRDDRVLRAMAAAGWRPGARDRARPHPGRGQSALLEHVQVCFDCCHFAVEYEDPADALKRLHRSRDAGRTRATELRDRRRCSCPSRTIASGSSSGCGRSPTRRICTRSSSAGMARSRTFPTWMTPRSAPCSRPRWRQGVADPLPRAAVHAELRRPGLDAGLRAARPRRRRCARGSRRTSRSKPTPGTSCPMG